MKKLLVTIMIMMVLLTSVGCGKDYLIKENEDLGRVESLKDESILLDYLSNYENDIRLDKDYYEERAYDNSLEDWQTYFNSEAKTPYVYEGSPKEVPALWKSYYKDEIEFLTIENLNKDMRVKFLDYTVTNPEIGDLSSEMSYQIGIGEIGSIVSYDSTQLTDRNEESILLYTQLFPQSEELQKVQDAFENQDSNYVCEDEYENVHLNFENGSVQFSIEIDKEEEKVVDFWRMHVSLTDEEYAADDALSFILRAYYETFFKMNYDEIDFTDAAGTVNMFENNVENHNRNILIDLRADSGRLDLWLEEYEKYSELKYEIDFYDENQDLFMDYLKYIYLNKPETYLVDEDLYSKIYISENDHYYYIITVEDDAEMTVLRMNK